MLFPADYLYTRRHQWLKLDGRKARIGLTVYAEHQAGTVSFFDFPEIGRVVRRGEKLCSLETVKAAVEIESPVSGRVVRVNEDLAANPLMFHVDPFAYWLVEVEMENDQELSSLLTAWQYELYLKEELS